jgi:hypothetical protein
VTAAPAAEAPALVKPVTCRRCKGTGVVSELTRRAHLGVPGLCFKCDGSGKVEGDRETLRRQKEEAAAAEARWAIAVEFFRAHPQEVRWGYDVLEVLEPERARKAIASIEAGHAGVAAALVAYFEANSERAWAQLNARR